MDEYKSAATTLPPIYGNVDQLRAHALALMFLAGATLALLVPALPGTDQIDTGLWALNASVGIPVAVLLWHLGHRAPVPLLHLCLLLGAALVAVGMTFGDGASVTVAAAFFFVWVALYSFLFFPWRSAAAHVAIDAVLLVGALHVAGVNAAASVGVLVVGTSTVVGAVTGRSRFELERLATTDALTGLGNRRRLDEALDAESARSARTDEPYSVIVADLDRFKTVNDDQGHAAGDHILISSARAWTACLRPTDLLTRYGGDEFVALLPGCGQDEAIAVADRLATAVSWSCSFGTATAQAQEHPASVLSRADEHLMQAKRAGGGQIISGTTEK